MQLPRTVTAIDDIAPHAGGVIAAVGSDHGPAGALLSVTPRGVRQLAALPTEPLRVAGGDPLAVATTQAHGAAVEAGDAADLQTIAINGEVDVADLSASGGRVSAAINHQTEGVPSQVQLVEWTKRSGWQSHEPANMTYISSIAASGKMVFAAMTHANGRAKVYSSSALNSWTAVSLPSGTIGEETVQLAAAGSTVWVLAHGLVRIEP